MRRRGALPWLGLLLVVLVVVVIAGAPRQRNNRPFDPTSTGPRGAKAVVVLLEELGARVDVTAGAPADSADTAIILIDRLAEADADAVEDWVEDGGVLLIADPFSPLAPDRGEGGCPDALDVVDELSAGPGPSGSVERGGDCFDGFVSAVSDQAGDIVAVGDPVPFTNDLLDEEDNAVLAATVLAPTGAERIAFLTGSAGGGDEQLFDLLGPRAAQAIAQLAVAVGLFVLWQGRRLGRPVTEPQAVSIAGSELVAAVGRLISGRKRPEEAAATVRAEVRRALERRLGLPADAPPAAVADAVADRTGMDPGRVAAALGTRTVSTEDDLLDVLADLDRIRDLALHAPTARPETTSPGGTR